MVERRCQKCGKIMTEFSFWYEKGIKFVQYICSYDGTEQIIEV